MFEILMIDGQVATVEDMEMDKDNMIWFMLDDGTDVREDYVTYIF